MSMQLKIIGAGRYNKKDGSGKACNFVYLIEREDQGGDRDGVGFDAASQSGDASDWPLLSQAPGLFEVEMGMRTFQGKVEPRFKPVKLLKAGL